MVWRVSAQSTIEIVVEGTSSIILNAVNSTFQNPQSILRIDTQPIRPYTIETVDDEKARQENEDDDMVATTITTSSTTLAISFTLTTHIALLAINAIRSSQ